MPLDARECPNRNPGLWQNPKGVIRRRKAEVASLQKAKELLQKEERKADRILHEVKGILQSEPLARVDYAQIFDATTLQDVDRIEGDVVIALAAYLGKTRLTDNLVYRTF